MSIKSHLFTGAICAGLTASFMLPAEIQKENPETRQLSDYGPVTNVQRIAHVSDDGTLDGIDKIEFWAFSELTHNWDIVARIEGAMDIEEAKQLALRFHVGDEVNFTGIINGPDRRNDLFLDLDRNY